MQADFVALMRAALERGETLDELVDVVHKYKAAGLSQRDAQTALESLRTGADNATDDRILELLDFVTGWCAPHHRIWG